MHYSYEKFDSSHKGSKFLRDNLDSFTNLIKSIIILINLIKKIWWTQDKLTTSASRLGNDTRSNLFRGTTCKVGVLQSPV